MPDDSSWDRDALRATLGGRLEDAGRRLARRHVPDFPWAGPLTSALDRVEALRTVQADRFRRREVSPDAPRQREVLPGLPRLGSRRDRPVASVRGADQGAPEVAGPSARGQGVAAPPAPPEPAPSRGHPLDPDVRARLRAVAGPAADVLRVRTDREADSVARKHRADAVTTGSEVLFRSGRFVPRDPLGFGLLAHEATHVERLIGRVRAVPGPEDAHEEERVALSRERRARRGMTNPSVTPGRLSRGAPATGSTPLVASSPAPSPVSGSSLSTVSAASHTPVRAAPSDRDAGATASGIDLDSMRRSVVEDLMRQLRTEFERGG